MPSPAAISRMRGNSTRICPAQIQTPAWRFRPPAANVAAVIGPGAMTPESETPTMVKMKPAMPPLCSLRPCNRCQPRLRTFGAKFKSERPWNRLEVGRLDLPHVPALAESIPDLLLGNASGAFGSRLLVGEAEEIERSARPKDFFKAPHEYRPLLIRKRVEQPTVDHGVELPAELAKFQCVPNDEMGVDSRSAAFAVARSMARGTKSMPQASWPPAAR